MRLDQRLQFPGPRNLQPVNHRVLSPRIVIDKRHHAVLAAVVQRRKQLPPGFPGAVDQHVFRAGAQPCLVAGSHHQT